MIPDWKVFAIKLVVLVAISPLIGMAFRNVLCIYSRINGLASLATICSLCYSPICLAGIEIDNHALLQAEMGQPVGVLEDFDELEDSLQEAENLIAEARAFLHAFIDQLNARYMTQISLQQACQLVKENFASLQIPTEIQSEFLEVIELLGKEEVPSPRQANAMFPPWKWNWFRLNKKDKRQDSRDEVHSTRVQNTDGLPGFFQPSTVIGTAEAIVGSTLVYGTAPAGVGAVLGAALLADGIRRIADDGLSDFQDGLRKGRNFDGED